MYLFVNVETREVIATRKATRNENEGGGGKIHGERNTSVHLRGVMIRIVLAHTCKGCDGPYCNSAASIIIIISIVVIVLPIDSHSHLPFFTPDRTRRLLQSFQSHLKRRRSLSRVPDLTLLQAPRKLRSALCRARGVCSVCTCT